MIVGLGEVLWDMFPAGPRFGGAPANFACSVAGLAPGPCSTCLVSAVGQDELGREALRELAEHGVDAACVGRLEQQTGQVLVNVDPAGHASYEFAANTAWDNLSWSEELQELAHRTGAVCFGTLGQRSSASRDVVRRFLQSTPGDCLRVFDINLRSPFWTESIIRESLPLARVLKCNDAELPILATMLGFSGSDDEILRALVSRFSLQLAALTRGAGGSLLVDHAGDLSELRGVPTTVVDTVGAGDSFTAALTLGLTFGVPLSIMHGWASRVAAYVCGQSGATPEMPEELRMQPEWSRS